MNVQLQDNKKLSIFNNPAIGYLGVLSAAMVLYVISCAPGVLWGDSGEFQLRIWNGDLQSNLGLALSHPLYIIIGIAVKYISLGEFAYRINLISALAGAFAVANLFLLIRLWQGKNFPAIIAATTLALSWTTWQNAVIAEVYTLHLALFGAELIILLQYCKTTRNSWLYLLALVNGLAIANHMFAAINLVCYTVFVLVLLTKKEINFKHIGVMAMLWFVGALPYEYLIVRNIVEGGGVTKTLLSAAFGNYWAGNVLNVSLSSRLVKENLTFILYNFPTPNILFFFGGLYFVLKKSMMRAFGNIFLALLTLLFVFAFRYMVADRYVFFMPFFWLAAALIGIGADMLIAQMKHKVIPYLIVLFALVPCAVYFVVPVMTQQLEIKLPNNRTIPYRNEHTWFLQTWKTGYHGPEKFVDDLFSTIEDNAAIVADWNPIKPLLYYQQVHGRRRDLKIISSFDQKIAAEALAETSVYVVEPTKGYCPGFLLENYDFVPVGCIWRVVEKK